MSKILSSDFKYQHIFFKTLCICPTKELTIKNLKLLQNSFTYVLAVTGEDVLITRRAPVSAHSVPHTPDYIKKLHLSFVKIVIFGQIAEYRWLRK